MERDFLCILVLHFSCAPWHEPKKKKKWKKEKTISHESEVNGELENESFSCAQAKIGNNEAEPTLFILFVSCLLGCEWECERARLGIGVFGGKKAAILIGIVSKMKEKKRQGIGNRSIWGKTGFQRSLSLPRWNFVHQKCDLFIRLFDSNRNII